jgi:acetyl-CoA acyltransferase
VELNEAFAVQSLACIDAWEVDLDIANSRGGAIAIGHLADLAVSAGTG